MECDISKWKSFLLRNLHDTQIGNEVDKNKLDESNPKVNSISRIGKNNGDRYKSLFCR